MRAEFDGEFEHPDSYVCGFSWIDVKNGFADWQSHGIAPEEYFACLFRAIFKRDLGLPFFMGAGRFFTSSLLR